MARLTAEHFKYYRIRLREALLACPSIQQPAQHDALFAELPTAIRNTRSTQSNNINTITLNLIDTADNYDHGIDDCLDAIENVEGKSLSLQHARDEWQLIQQEMTEQELLIGWLGKIHLAPDVWQQAYNSAEPGSYTPIPPTSIAGMVSTLWRCPDGREPLHVFLRQIESQPETPPAIQQKISQWRQAAPPTPLAAAADAAEAVRIIVVIEEGIQNPDSRLVSLWVADEDGFENIEHKQDVADTLLRQAISTQIDGLLFDDSDMIECYLPKAMATLPIDTWEMGSGGVRQRFSERYRIHNGILERQDARMIRRELGRVQKNHRDGRRLLSQLARSPWLKELVRRTNDWETRWERLFINRDFEQLTTLLSQIDATPDTDDSCIALLAQTPDNLASDQYDDPLGLVLGAGIPIILWVRSGDDSAEFVDHLQCHLLDPHCAKLIRSADDIVKLVRHLRKHVLDEQQDPHQIGRNLSLIVDNPKSKLPSFFQSRITM